MSGTRDSFKAALEDTRRYRPDHIGRRPAFTFSLERSRKPRRVDVRALPKAKPPRRAGGAADAAVRLANREISSVELVQQTMAAIERRQRELNAFTHIEPGEKLLAQGKALDAERAAGRLRGPLHGIPVSIKDVIHVHGMPTTSSSKVMAGYMPAEDATAVRRLREAGAIITGKTHTHEFALGVTTPQSRNPWDSSRDPGGSSGGSAISVAAGMSLLSLGTDTRASIRVPASLCGITGYKPTYGLVSTEGIVTLSWSIDHAGLQGRGAEDVALMMNAVQGLDPKDPNTVDLPPQDYTQFVGRDVRGLRVGLAINGLQGARPEVGKAFEETVVGLRSLGVQTVEASVPTHQDFHLATSLGLILSRCEAAAFHSAFDNPGPLYTTAVHEQMDEANQVKAVDYLRAQRFRGEFMERMRANLENYDALLMPTTLAAAPKAEESGDYFMLLSQNCIPWSMIGFPALSVPCGFTPQGLPVGAQFVASPFDDSVILALASALESVTEDRRP